MSQLVENFFSASQDQGGIRSRNNYVTQQYLDYCKKHGYSGLRLYFDTNEALLYQDFRIADTEQINRKKFCVYCGMIDGKWRFWPLE
ncbi:MAG: hypothetical protein K2O34_04980 [Acetatifactor sp.]|nr:hypothetical protein [Acetatifactor sp.]